MSNEQKKFAPWDSECPHESRKNRGHEWYTSSSDLGYCRACGVWSEPSNSANSIYDNLSQDQINCLIAALDNHDVLPEIRIFEGLFLIKMGLAKEVQNKDASGKPLQGWHAHLRLTPAGKLFAQALKLIEEQAEALRKHAP